MRSRVTNDTSRRAGTSHQLSTFAVLGEEEELIERRWQEEERRKEEQERRERERERLDKVKLMNWADVDDDEDFGHTTHSDTVHKKDDNRSEEDDEEPLEEEKQQIFIDIKADRTAKREHPPF
eukprot:Gregarina_sp_Poly_1__10234@NODE_710_length_6658_cov_139_932484_g537_i0_p8_GENE_NODE_710_length_6658_cov_139_932484_g537_i0NODE_710_length_6658_cov_139_932484_g537_i0_p8_ORF_typecomplete_len123_score28_84DUF2052/PF09747_9/0_16Cwf_Cwc_15/PF04889_12/0_49DMAP1/PF05499_12/0_76FYDLN_acid/PF09538_10/0_86DUF3682/PF12446_8/31DUF3682/PF12446_8/1_8_NODE_710_length_6658_cov_139_932484_g537_i061926560